MPPAGLIMLCIVPALAGFMRLHQITSGADITAENSRFLAQPTPVVLHIISSLVYCVLGAFQFSEYLRCRFTKAHRVSGRVLVVLGLVSSSSGLVMTLYYPWAPFDGAALFAVRLVVGAGMFIALCLGFNAIRQRNFAAHRNWMMRAYAIGLGAGTQVFTHIPLMIYPALQGETSRTLMMTAGWVINLMVAEVLISKKGEPLVARALKR
jgi:uncharacterized membrane protein